MINFNVHQKDGSWYVFFPKEPGNDWRIQSGPYESEDQANKKVVELHRRYMDDVPSDGGFGGIIQGWK